MVDSKLSDTPPYTSAGNGDRTCYSEEDCDLTAVMTRKKHIQDTRLADLVNTTNSFAPFREEGEDLEEATSNCGEQVASGTCNSKSDRAPSHLSSPPPLIFVPPKQTFFFCHIVTGFLLCLLFIPEESCDIFLSTVDFHRTARPYFPEDRNLHCT
jgi:hypothetical protein